ncbi:hypothetical protein, conserved [Eimeria brunetti]|uniref:Uncharacterized protein n=1 Tax=Eimeria brunetti TaxID=51314 RepID=U6LUM3_9EIME|nr:hypothetical protein, conserved [Eimeria brunetti]
MCSRICEGRYYLAWLYLATLATCFVEGNAAYAELTSTDAVSLRDLSQDTDDYTLGSVGQTNSMIGLADEPLHIRKGAASLYSKDRVPFPVGNRKVRRQALKEHPARQTRPSEDGARDMVITEAYLVGHLPEKHIQPPGKAFWVEKLMILSLIVAWLLIGHRALAEGAFNGLSRTFVTVWTLGLLMSLLRKTPDRTHGVASTGDDRQSQAAGNGRANKVSLRKIFANILSVIFTFFLVLLFGPLVFFITGALLAAMLIAVFAIAICLLHSPAVQQNLVPHVKD